MNSVCHIQAGGDEKEGREITQERIQAKADHIFFALVHGDSVKGYGREPYNFANAVEDINLDTHYANALRELINATGEEQTAKSGQALKMLLSSRLNNECKSLAESNYG